MAVAEVLQDAVRAKPADLLEYVAQRLQERSGLDAGIFEAQFEECKRKPRSYVLEEQCPAGQDPFSWVPMRYNDDTILSMLQTRAHEIATDILAPELIENSQDFIQRARVAFPELMYLRGAQDLEQTAAQMLRAVYVGCSNCPSIEDKGLDDADPMLAFRCRPLVTCVRSCLLESCRELERMDALMVCCVLSVVGRHPGFQQRFGGGFRTSELAVIYALEHEPDGLPSFSRLSLAHKHLVLAALQCYFSMEMLLSTEVVPLHFARVKDLLASREKGAEFFLAVIGVEHLVRCRSAVISDANVDSIRLAAQCILALSKHSAQRGYELFLKKRAERHSWRLARDDVLQKALIRLCCMRGDEDDEAWAEMDKAMESLREKDLTKLKIELGQKDGLTEDIVYVLHGGAALMAAAGANRNVGPAAALSLLCRALTDVAHNYGKVLTQKVIKLHIESLATRAVQYRAGGGSLFAETPFVLEERGAGEIAVVLPGV